VIGLDNLAYGPREQVPAGVDFRPVDIRDPGLVAHFAGCDAIFHLAAKNCIADCQDDPLETADINVTGTVNVLSSARDAGVCGYLRGVLGQSTKARPCSRARGPRWRRRELLCGEQTGERGLRGCLRAL